MNSLSVFERDLIIENYKFADIHFEYCRSICKFYHTDTCLELAKLRNKSYVRCNSHYCKKYNFDYGYSITYEKNVLLDSLPSKTVRPLVYYSDDEELSLSYSDCDELI